ncbi:GNAT family N-acetyltransferase [Croceitalea rosinachiae]|uniref:GNAT family N-acetyltransferase n=1 Tax=Croceitalea rosinachiae TaxID=3075596 RepID=A0ABU3A8Q8_9FLAO|nr:GNAT family N-acetyltransferase [Croceitalea sp. F388]MDT0606565.1 GNAT family N-acetyltransferase [Croceitalea sp. F388]
MTIYKQADSIDELKQILELQQKNLPKNLSPIEMKQSGFLTVEHSFELLKEMNVIAAHTIAKDGEQVIGYALSMHPEFANQIEILKPMFEEIHKVVSKNNSYMVMGQICVAKAYRGQGVFRKLYTAMKTFLPEGFTKIITEVDAKNVRSMNAHKAIGFTELKRYHSKGKDWSLIVQQ